MDLQKITTGVTAAAVVGTGATVGVHHQLDKIQGGPEKRIEAERNELRIIISEEVYRQLKGFSTTTGGVNGIKVPNDYRLEVPNGSQVQGNTTR